MILFEGPIYNSTGYGSVVRNIIYHYKNINPEFYVEHIVGHPSEDEKIKSEVNNFRKHLPKTEMSKITHHIKFDLCTRYRAGIGFHLPHRGKKIGMTMFETDHLPLSWVKASSLANRTWVPSQYCKEVFLKAKISNVKILPFGVDRSIFHRTNKYAPIQGLLDLNELKNKVVYLAVLDFVHRKAPDVIVKGFCQAFNKRDKVILILKTTSPLFNKDQILKYIRQYVSSFNYVPPIILIHSKLTSEQLRVLYSLADVHLQPSRNEGFGLTVLEAMACGTPSIVTKFSGVLDFCDEDTTYFVGISGWKKADGFGIGPRIYDETCKFMEPNMNDYIDQLKFTCRNIQDVKGIVNNCIERSKEWSWNKTVSLVNKYINE